MVAAALGGLIWTIQGVHYPLFALVGHESWLRYDAEHQRRITRIVLPLMVANVALAVALVVQRDEPLAWANAALAVLGTAFVIGLAPRAELRTVRGRSTHRAHPT